MSWRTNYLRSTGASQLSDWLLLLGGLLLLATITLILRTPSADGLELSIYAAYSPVFWVLLVAAFFVGTFLILREAFAETPRSQYWVGGFVLSFFSAAVVVFLPTIRGYAVYGRADLLTHIGHTRAIEQTGGAPFLNIYQNIHQVFLTLSYATGLEPLALANAVAAVITLFSILASYALLSEIFERRRLLLTLPFILAFVAGSTHINPSPYAQSVLFLPFVLYLFARTQETDALAFRFPLALTVVAVVLYHPLTALFLFVVFLIHYLVITVSTWKGTLDTSGPVSRVSATSIVQLVGVTFLAWYYNFAGIILRFDVVLRRLLNPGESETELDTYGDTIAEFSPSIEDLARVGALQYGHRFLFLSLGAAFTAIALWRYTRGNRFTTPYLSTFTLGFIAFSGFGVLFLAVDLIGGFGRPLAFAQYFAAFTAGSILLELYNRTTKRRLLFVCAVFFSILLVTSGVITMYHSPAAGQSTSQVTQQDISSAEWYLENDLQETPLQEYGTTMYRFEHALVSSQSNTVQREATIPPDGFNYTEHETLGESYDTDQYLIVTERGKQFYPNAYPDYEDSWRFHPADFEALDHDPTVTMVYTNDEIEIYRIDSGDGS